MSNNRSGESSPTLDEILYACHLVSCMFDTHVLEEICESTPHSDEIYVAAEGVSDAITGLYQHIDRLRVEAMSKEPPK